MEILANKQIILKVYLDPNCTRVIDIPITPDTTCEDVIECCKEPGEEQCHLAELWRECERPIDSNEKPYEILQQWGIHRDEVQFYLRHEPVPPTQNALGRKSRKKSAAMKTNGLQEALPSGVDLKLGELQEMAARQQHQIDSQQQILVAKEQRLKFLKQQEMKQEQIVSESERLKKLREKVESQELKLKKLRALRGQVDQHRQSNSNLTSELESIKTLFNEKEKELSLAVSKVEELRKQLDNFRQNSANMLENNNKSSMSLEIEKLKRELLMRNKLNEHQSQNVVLAKEKLVKKRGELSAADRRIEELTDRLQRKRAQQTHHGSNKTNLPNRASNIAAVEPIIQQAPKDTRDDMFKETPMFKPNKNDPKYQTLPPNLKFPSESKSGNEIQVYHQHQAEVKGNVYGKSEKNVNSRPEGNGKNVGYKANIHNMAPRPYGSNYVASGNDGNKEGVVNGRGQPEGLISNGQNSLSSIDESKMYTSTPVTTETAMPGLQRPPAYTSSTPTASTSARQFYKYPSTSDQSSSILAAGGTSAPNYVPQTRNGHDTRSTAPFYRVSSSSSIPSPVSKVNDQNGFNGQGPPTNVGQGQPRPFLSYGQQSHDMQPPVSSNGQSAPSGGQSVPMPPWLHSTVPVSSSAPGSAKHTFRYAPKSVIANTYMRKLGQNTLDQYRQNMMQLYKDFYPKSKDDQQQGNQPFNNGDNSNQPSSPTAKVRPLNFETQPSSSSSERRDLEGTDTSKPESKGARLNNGPPPPYPSTPSYQQPSTDKESVHQNGDTAKNKTVVRVPESSTSFVGGDKNKEDKYSYPPYPPPTAQEAPTAKQGQEQDMQNKTQSGFMKTKSILKTEPSSTSLRPLKRNVNFNPLALLLDASLEGELELVKKAAKEVKDVSEPNDEGITAVHNAICAGHLEIVKFLVEFGCDVNSPDSDGWTPLHCAASCNNLPMVKFLVEHGACIFATTISDQETAAEKCEEDEDGYDGCSEYLYSVQEKLGILNEGAVYSLFDYKAQNSDEINLKLGDKIVVLRKGDDIEKEWWWSKLRDREGYIARNLTGLHPRVVTQTHKKN